MTAVEMVRYLHDITDKYLLGGMPISAIIAFCLVMGAFVLVVRPSRCRRRWWMIARISGIVFLFAAWVIVFRQTGLLGRGTPDAGTSDTVWNYVYGPVGDAALFLAFVTSAVFLASCGIIAMDALDRYRKRRRNDDRLAAKKSH